MDPKEILEILQKWQSIFFVSKEAFVIDANVGFIGIQVWDSNGKRKDFEFDTNADNTMKVAEMTMALTEILHEILK